MTLRTMGLIVVVTMVLAVAGPASAALTALEDFSGCPTGSYSDYGGNNLGAVGKQPGWYVGGRYFDITNRSGANDMTPTDSYDSLTIGTALDNTNSHWPPVYVPGTAISLSGSTYLEFKFTNNYAFNVGFAGGVVPVILCYYDTSASTTATVTLFYEGDWASLAPGASQIKDVTLSSISGFDPSADKIYGIDIEEAFGYVGGGNYGSLTWNSVSYDAVPEPATLAFLAFGGLGMIGAAIRRRLAR